jgi:beta-glucosidase
MNNGFPQEFLWGVATASAQIEGAYLKDGRTPSIWDAAPDKRLKNGENCHIACDHYHRYKEDIAIMKKMGVQSYRFSLSWSRIIPAEGQVNELGIAFYNALIDELLAAGITPIITLYHWDLPLWVETKYQGWLNQKIVDLFAEYTRVVTEAFSDRVTLWLTFNEPQCFLMNGYITKVHAPFKRVIFRFSRLIRHFMKANKVAIETIRRHAKKPPKIGLSFGSGAYIPEDENNPASVEEARYKSFYKGMGSMNNRLFLDPIILGKGVSTHLIYHVSRKFAPKIKVDFDFLAINNYEAFNYSPWGNGKVDKTNLPTNSLGWVIDGRTLYWTAKFFYERYKLPILITENGMCDNEILVDGEVNDDKRIAFMNEYIHYVKKAINDGVDIKGFHYWSLLDNFEWAEGYKPRFGLVYVDYKTLERTMKKSAYHYANIIKTNGKDL